MPLTEVQQCRLELGDTDAIPFQYLSDDEYEYFLEKNNFAIRRTCVDAAKTILFKLSRYTREYLETMEVYGNQHFEQYKQALMLFIKDPNFSIANSCVPYAGGISKTDITENIQNADNNYVDVQRAVPQEGQGFIVNTDIFNQARDNSQTNPFKV